MCRSLEERQNAIRGVAGYTKIGLEANPKVTKDLRSRGIIQTPADIGVDPARASRSLLAAKTVKELVEISGGLYDPPARFRGW
jgi:malonate decarboxylase alpha subunit